MQPFGAIELQYWFMHSQYVMQSAMEFPPPASVALSDLLAVPVVLDVSADALSFAPASVPLPAAPPVPAVPPEPPLPLEPPVPAEPPLPLEPPVPAEPPLPLE